MSIELSSAPKGAKAAAGANLHGNKAGKAGAATGEDSSGFSALMNLLSAAEDGAAGLAADTSLTNAPRPEKDGLSTDVTAAVGVTLLLQPFPTPVPAQVPVGVGVGDAFLTPPAVVSTELAEEVPGVALMPAQAAHAALGGTLLAGSNANVSDAASQPIGRALPQTDALSVGLPNQVRTPGKTADTGAQQKLTLASAASDGLGVNAAVVQAVPDVPQASPVSALLAHKSAVQAQTLNAIQQDLKEVRVSASPQSVVLAADSAANFLAGGLSDLVRPQGRFGARAGMGQSGSSGFDGAFGQAMAGIHRADAAFEVPATSAVVPDTAVAETVSYWASHGVQTAELTLEGFGDEPVEVSILLNGDQAQIDFRTDQVGVRQVLENAASELKDMLSSQGLQLAGVSVGTSGKGDDGGERRQRSAAQQLTLVKTEAVGVAPARAANPAVGRSLDLFV